MNKISVNLTRFAMWFAGATIVFGLVIVGTFYAFGQAYGGAVLPVIPAMVAAMVEGTKWAKERPDPIPHPWLDAGAMACVALFVTVFMIFTAVLTIPGASAGGISAFAILAPLYLLIWLICGRIFLGLGVRNERAVQGR
ncbi:MAG: ABZJ_00895 family protein [Pseudomonadota bacterium]